MSSSSSVATTPTLVVAVIVVVVTAVVVWVVAVDVVVVAVVVVVVVTGYLLSLLLPLHCHCLSKPSTTTFSTTFTWSLETKLLCKATTNQIVTRPDSLDVVLHLLLQPVHLVGHRHLSYI